MKIGILQCGSVSEEFQPRFGDYPAMLIELLLRADPTLTFVNYRVQEGEFPEDIDAVDAYITTGSRFGVNDDLPWIDELLALLRTLHSAKKKVFGVCFGHQAMAKAMGGRVVLADQGWGVGISHNQVVAQKEWMQPFKAEIDVVVSHQEQVIELPPGAELLASSVFCPNYMFALGSDFVGIQGHPEFSKVYADALLEARRDRIPAAVIDRAKESFAGTTDDEIIAAWVARFLRGVETPKA